jgi:3-phenylpropionate/trans-cinnamate dioxygenase ferredoxin reductase component
VTAGAGRGGMVVVGASLAGAKAAEALRGEGYAGRITLVGDEVHRPYERPPLSKDFLQGKVGVEKVYVHAADWYAEHDVDLRLGIAVTAVDARAHEVTLAGGERLPYDGLLLATGSSPRRLTIPGAELDGVHYLRRIEDSERIRDAFANGRSVAIVGGGWIGLEAAAAARAAGRDVTVLEAAELPLLAVLGREVAQVFADLHRANGVDLRCGVQVSEFTGDAAGAGGAVTGVQLADGRRLDADVVVVGVGITPNVGLAEEAGLEVGNGILVDAHLRTSDSDVYAAGDVANAYHPLLDRHIRVEHWANALNGPAVAAKSMLGIEAVYDRLPYFYSDQYDLGMEYTGYVDRDASVDVVLRGDVAGREFVAFWLSGGRVLAGMNVNVWDVTEPITELVRSGRVVDAARLADAEVPLADL